MKIRVKPSLRIHKPVIHGGLYSQNLHNSKILDFSSNINPINLPRSVTKSALKQVKKINNYPDINSFNLLSALEIYTKTPKSNLVVGNGAIEILYNFCNAYLANNTPVLIPVPTFEEYSAASKLSGSKVHYFKTMNLSNDISKFISKIPKKGCVFLCNPNNPTGKLLSKTHLLEIVYQCQQKNSLIFVDECFIELVPASNESIIHHVKKFDNLIVLRSLTKSFGLAGIRIGYAASSRHIIEILKKIKIPWSVSTIAESSAISALNDLTHIARSNLIIQKEYVFLRNEIDKINGFECLDSKTNFILIKTREDSTKIQKKLLKKNILIRDCKNFRGLTNHFIRIAIKSHEDNLKLVKALVSMK